MKQKKVWIVGVLLVCVMFFINIFSAPVLGSQDKPSSLLEKMIFSENNHYSSPLIKFLIGRYSSPFPWSILLKDYSTYRLNTFTSYDELVDFLKENNKEINYYGYMYEMEDGGAFLDVPKATNQARDSENSLSGDSTIDYSETNIQVEGVDEPDTVKTDGTYLYVVANSKIYILKAYPASDASVLSEISIDTDEYDSNIFVNDDRLIVFGNSIRYPETFKQDDNSWVGSISTTKIKIFDISDIQNPNLIKDIEVDGNYFDSRMIDNHVYLISTEYSSNIYRSYDKKESINIPQIKIDDESSEIPYDQIYYVDVPESIDTITHVISVDINSNDIVSKSFLLGSSQNMYVSKDNVFLACTKYDYIAPLMENMYGYSEQKTIIHKISIDSGDITYSAQGEVPGTILNQFSMDEYDGYFRIATTISGYSNNVDTSTNNMYVLDSDLDIVGRLEEVAPGESIYSVRFMGEKAYMVTFRHIDPLFVIDLKNPTDPKILGKLKIPGYSDYLHPIDENHLIGIGKEVDASIDADKIHTEGAVYYTAIQGVKISIFDVSDVENPIELYKEVIGDRGTESPATSDHKAFLYDKQKDLLVLPIIVAELKEGQDKSEQGDYTFQGSYVYDLSVDDGINLKGRITHIDDPEELFSKSGYYWYDDSSFVTRSLYIGDTLYTFSDEMVKMNNLYSLEEINSVSLN